MKDKFDGMAITRKASEYAKKKGADKAQVHLGRDEKYELDRKSVV
jgi:hypothetical protein